MQIMHKEKMRIIKRMFTSVGISGIVDKEQSIAVGRVERRYAVRKDCTISGTM